MNKNKKIINELIVDLFNFILVLEEKYMHDKGINLTMSEIHLLDMVKKTKDNTSSNIADALLITKATFSINSARLVKKGYLEKVTDSVDKRISRVHLTKAADKILKVHEEFHNEIVDVITQGMEESDNPVLIEGIEYLTDYLKRYYTYRNGIMRKKENKFDVFIEKNM